MVENYVLVVPMLLNVKLSLWEISCTPICFNVLAIFWCPLLWSTFILDKVMGKPGFGCFCTILATEELLEKDLPMTFMSSRTHNMDSWWWHWSTYKSYWTSSSGRSPTCIFQNFHFPPTVEFCPVFKTEERPNDLFPPKQAISYVLVWCGHKSVKRFGRRRPWREVPRR